MATKAHLLLGFALLGGGLSACSNTQLETFKSYADQMCACKDEACADEIHKGYAAYAAANPVAKYDPKYEAMLSAEASRYLGCRLALRPGPPPGAKVYTDPKPANATSGSGAAAKSEP